VLLLVQLFGWQDPEKYLGDHQDGGNDVDRLFGEPSRVPKQQNQNRAEDAVDEADLREELEMVCFVEDPPELVGRTDLHPSASLEALPHTQKVYDEG